MDGGGNFGDPVGWGLRFADAATFYNRNFIRFVFFSRLG